jgi:hypothetical protein
MDGENFEEFKFITKNSHRQSDFLLLKNNLWKTFSIPLGSKSVEEGTE